MALSFRWITIGFRLAIAIATASKDKSTQVGCAILNPNKSVNSLGFNGFPSSIEDDSEILADKARREEKYALMIHAEANAIDRAVGGLQGLTGASLFVTHHPCSKCALRIAATPIKNVLYLEDKEFEERNKEDLAISKTIFEKASVSFTAVNKDRLYSEFPT